MRTDAMGELSYNQIVEVMTETCQGTIAKNGNIL